MLLVDADARGSHRQPPRTTTAMWMDRRMGTTLDVHVFDVRDHHRRVSLPHRRYKGRPPPVWAPVELMAGPGSVPSAPPTEPVSLGLPPGSISRSGSADPVRPSALTQSGNPYRKSLGTSNSAHTADQTAWDPHRRRALRQLSGPTVPRRRDRGQQKALAVARTGPASTLGTRSVARPRPYRSAPSPIRAVTDPPRHHRPFGPRPSRTAPTESSMSISSLGPKLTRSSCSAKPTETVPPLTPCNRVDVTVSGCSPRITRSPIRRSCALRVDTPGPVHWLSVSRPMATFLPVTPDSLRRAPPADEARRISWETGTHGSHRNVRSTRPAGHRGRPSDHDRRVDHHVEAMAVSPSARYETTPLRIGII